MLDYMNLSLAQQEELLRIRRHLHRHPELSFQEFETAAFIKDWLDNAGIPYRTVGGTGVVAEITGEKAGVAAPKTVVLRADIDALPITENTGLPFSSEKEGVMHACGHDMHAAMLLVTGGILNSLRAEFAGTVKLVFQPAEEFVMGAAKMINEDPFMDGVDYVLGTHVMCHMPCGTLGVRSAGLFFGGERFQIHIEGKEGHGAQPHTAIDALLAGSAIVSNTQLTLARETNVLDPAVATICMFHAGNAPNVIAGEADLSGTIRFFSEKRRAALKGSMDRSVEQIAGSFDCKGSVIWDRYVPAVENDPWLDAFVRKAATELLGADAVREAAQLTSSDDFSWYTQNTKGYYMILGSGTGDPERSTPHTPMFTPDENCMPLGVATFVKLAVELLQGE
ncbi:MAG: amidohydrolase [Mogibacterium sp.]|nr:amidohydrolase [Mogibacterium sp.]